jgi:hypothetical protein
MTTAASAKQEQNWQQVTFSKLQLIAMLLTILTLLIGSFISYEKRYANIEYEVKFINEKIKNIEVQNVKKEAELQSINEKLTRILIILERKKDK